MRQTLMTALVLGMAGMAWAQTAAPAGEAPKPPKIGVIDMGRISTDSVLGKSYAAQLESLKSEIDAEGNKKQAELGKMEAQIKALQDEVEKQGGVLSDEARERKKQEIVKRTRDYQAFGEDSQQELKRMRDRAQDQFQKLNADFHQKIQPVIELVAKEKSFDILLDSQVALTVNRAYDISQDIIQKSDEMERSKPKTSENPAPKPAGPRPAAAKPAAKAAPAASPAPAPTPPPNS